MQFELTPELIDQLLFAMENQDEEFVVDAVSLLVVPFSQLPAAARDDSGRYYAVPEWRPSDGFRTMEAFCAGTHNPVYRERLFEILSSGRRVFRRFKDVLRENPVLEHRWKKFKLHTMQRAVLAWYDSLCDAWGLERLAEEPEYSEELVRSEFSIRRRDEVADAEDYLHRAEQQMWQEMIREIGHLHAQRVKTIRDALCGRFAGGIVQVGVAPDGEIVGCIWLACPHPQGPAETGLLYVEPEFRGIGLAEQLIEAGVQQLRTDFPRCTELLFQLAGKGRTLLGYIERMGAEEFSSGYSLSLNAASDLQAGYGG